MLKEIAIISTSVTLGLTIMLAVVMIAAAVAGY